MTFNVKRYEHLLNTRYKAKIAEILLKNGRKLTKEAIEEFEVQLAQLLKDIMVECGSVDPEPTIRFRNMVDIKNFKRFQVVEIELFGTKKMLRLDGNKKDGFEV